MSDPHSGLRRLDETGVPLFVARVVLGGAFLWLGILKLRDPVGFLKALREYDMFPASQPWLMNLTAAALPGAEVLCGALLLLGIAVRGSALLLLVLLLVFTVAIAAHAAELADAQAIALCAVEFDCGCGSGVQNACKKLAENAGLMVLAAVALGSGSQRWCLRRVIVRG